MSRALAVAFKTRQRAAGWRDSNRIHPSIASIHLASWKVCWAKRLLGTPDDGAVEQLHSSWLPAEMFYVHIVHSTAVPGCWSTSFKLASHGDVLHSFNGRKLLTDSWLPMLPPRPWRKRGRNVHFSPSVATARRGGPRRDRLFNTSTLPCTENGEHH